MSGVFLGVDGGGTKTAFCLLDSEGALIAACEMAAAYHPGRADRVEQVMAEGLREAFAQAQVSAEDVAYAFFGLPGYGEISTDVPLLDAVPARLLGHQRYACDNDVVCGWAGSLGGADGVHVVSGTGSIGYGRRNGVGLRIGGWGEAFGDEGSGHWLGVAALQLFSRMSDGRAEPGPLLPIFREHLGLTADLDAVDVVINQWQRDRTPVAALSRPLVTAARAGDAAAAVLLEEAGVELALLAGAAIRRLNFAEKVPVSYSGGVFSVSEVLDAFARQLGPGVDLREPLFSPVVGAALHASGLAGTPVRR
jgi:N-acetylglucosamine kinase-like BadF-type ATPase